MTRSCGEPSHTALYADMLASCGFCCACCQMTKLLSLGVPALQLAGLLWQCYD